MSDDDKEFLKSLDIMINLDLLQSDTDWDMIQNMDVVDIKTVKPVNNTEELKLEDEE